MDQTEKAKAVAVVDPAIIALIHSFEPNEEARRAEAEDRPVSSIVRLPLKAYLERNPKARSNLQVHSRTLAHHGVPARPTTRVSVPC